MRSFTSLFTLCFVLLASVALCKTPKFKIKGMAFSSGHDLLGYRQPYADVSLRNLKKTGAKYIHITVIVGQETLESTKSYEVTDDASIKYIIRKVRKQGFKVFLKPIVQTRNFEWRGFIKGSPMWFNKVYIPYMVRMARIAQQEKVDILSVGSELKSTLDKKKQWINTIRRVKQIYKRGYLTYVANHDSYWNVPFWNSLDFISISAYFKLLEFVDKSNPPDQARTNRLWRQQVNVLLNWRRANKLGGKKILIAEAGAMSKGNFVTYTQPWDYDVVAPTDLNAQRMQYQALLSTFMPAKWCLGVILYDWELNPNAGKTMPTIQGYTPQNKPAEKVMTRFFKRSYN